MKLGKRLNTVVGLIDNCNLVVDVGADHGKLSAQLILLNKAQNVIATDISKLSLNKTIQLVQQLNISNRLKTVVADGLNFNLTQDVDYVVIAGMGAREIIKIISNATSPHLLKTKFILVSAQDEEYLRGGLNALNMCIISDITLQDFGKFYPVIVAEYGKENKPLNNIQLALGKFYKTDNSEDFVKKVGWLQNKLTKIQNYLSLKDKQVLKECNIILKGR